MTEHEPCSHCSHCEICRNHCKFVDFNDVKDYVSKYRKENTLLKQEIAKLKDA